MTVYCLDTDFYVLKRYEEILKKIVPKATVLCFASVSLLRKQIENAPPDILIAEANVPSVMPLLKSLAETSVNVILATGDQPLSREFVGLFPSGCFQKPPTEETLKSQLFHVRHPILSKIKK